MIVPVKPLPGTTIDPRFPDEDGRPMGDTDFHSDALIWLREALQDVLAGRKDGWYVASNLILYWDQNNPRNRRDPDVLVARGVGDHSRRSFRVWEEGTFPCVVFEVASRGTWREDVGPKRTLYARLGVPEYFLFDPEHRFISPTFQGFRLRKGVYVPMKRAREDGSLTSKELGLRFSVEGRMLRVFDLATGQTVPTRRERAEGAQKHADEVTRRARQEKRRADQATKRADEEKRRAGEQERRAEELAAEVERLREELKRGKR
jgi:Uma2 family endonuclease